MKKSFALALICCAAAVFAADVPGSAVPDTNILKSGNFEGVQRGRFFGEFDEKNRAKGGWLTDNKYVTAPPTGCLWIKRCIRLPDRVCVLPIRKVWISA